MVCQRNGLFSRSIASYASQLHCAIAQYLPHNGLPVLAANRQQRWTPRLLAVQAMLMAWSQGDTLGDRFAEARHSLLQMFPGRRRPGESYEGFVAALASCSQALLNQLSDHWRQRVRELLGAHWEWNGWVLFGVDGSKFDCPRTAANEQAFGVSGKNNSGPQQLLTSLFHLNSGLLWGWRRGGVRASEREHLRELLPLLPQKAMLVADAGFTGYDLLKSIVDSGRSFLIRVGSNIKLLKKLGYALREHEDIVYLWPEAKQRRLRRGPKRYKRLPKSLEKVSPPLTLRLIRLVDGSGQTVYLLTNILSRRELSDRTAGRIYGLRWGLEVAWRGLKQTMGHRKLLSGCARNAEMELDWAMAGFWMVGLVSARRMMERGQAPKDYSLAGALRVLRKAMSGQLRRGPALGVRLSQAVRDSYKRHGSKQARNCPRKKRCRPPGAPRARKATKAEIKLAAKLRTQEVTEPLAA